MRLCFCFWLGIFSFFPFSSPAQQEIPIGDWNSYLSFSNSYDVTQSPRYVYSAAGHGILRLDKEEMTIETITRVEGLTDAEPRSLLYDPLSSSLIIVYDNGNIDIMTEDGILNMPDILNNTSITTLKSPHRIRRDEEGHAYIAFDFGLIQIDLNLQVFGFTLRTPIGVNDLVEHGDHFYIATDDGIYFASSDPQVNHADFSIWERLGPGWPTDYVSHALEVIDDRLYADMNGRLVTIENDLPILLRTHETGYSIRRLSAVGNNLAVVYDHPMRKDDLLFVDANGTDLVSYKDKPCVNTLHHVIVDESGRFYLAEIFGLRRLDWLGSACHTFHAPGPPTRDAFEIAFRGQEVLVATGSVTNNYAPVWMRHGIYSYQDGEWSQFNHEDGFYGDTVQIYTDIAVSNTGELAVGVYNRGILRISPDWSEVEMVDQYNSCLTSQTLLPEFTTISDLQFDASGNLWVSNFSGDQAVKVIDREGSCYSFPIIQQATSNRTNEMALDARGHVWISTIDDTDGVIVIDPGELDDPGDDQIRVISANASALQDNHVRDIKADLDGSIWVGTDKGAIVFDCAASLFDFGCSGRQPVVVVDDVPALLLENERVQAIAIDGANRKWFGTANGIFVQSASGQDAIAHFDMSNSPLISNNVIDMEINPLTGEVLICTDRGIMSYRTEATIGGERHGADSTVYAFPNPVHPNYDGPIAIKGLPRDARVKITDVKGELVYESTAFGGTAIWDGRDYEGKRAASGVYLVFSTSQSAFEKPDAAITKILIVR